jgi:hypothetical protein
MLFINLIASRMCPRVILGLHYAMVDITARSMPHGSAIVFQVLDRPPKDEPDNCKASNTVLTIFHPGIETEVTRVRAHYVRKAGRLSPPGFSL